MEICGLNAPAHPDPGPRFQLDDALGPFDAEGVTLTALVPTHRRAGPVEVDEGQVQILGTVVHSTDLFSKDKVGVKFETEEG